MYCELAKNVICVPKISIHVAVYLQVYLCSGHQLLKEDFHILMQ